VTVRSTDADLATSAVDVARIVDVPGATAVMTALLPDGATDATAAFDDDHVTDCAAPFETATLAVRLAVWFSASEDVGAPEMTTEMTCGDVLLQLGVVTGHFVESEPHCN
jgi:hypothetical protein